MLAIYVSKTTDMFPLHVFILQFYVPPPPGSTLCFMLLLLLFKILLGLGTKTTVLGWGNMSWLKIRALVTKINDRDVPRPHEKRPGFEFGWRCRYFLSKISRKLSQGLLKSLFLCSLNNCDIVQIGELCSHWYFDSATIGQSPLYLCAKLS